MMITMNASTKTSSKIASTPDVNISFSASTSEVTPRHQPPTGLRSKNADMHPLDVPEDLAAQVEHDLLPGPLHQVGLQKLQRKRQQQRAKVQRRQAA